MIPTWQLRARFAVRLAEMYGTEVPAYHTLVDVCREVMQWADNGGPQQRWFLRRVG